MTKLIYLAAPYSDPDAAVCEKRVVQASRAAALLMSRYGLVVFSPITHGHSVAPHLPVKLAVSHEFWMAQCLPVLAKCDELFVLRLPGWDRSAGVKHEWDFAIRNNLPIRTVDFFRQATTPMADFILHLPKDFS